MYACISQDGCAEFCFDVFISTVLIAGTYDNQSQSGTSYQNIPPAPSSFQIPQQFSSPGNQKCFQRNNYFKCNIDFKVHYHL